MASRFQIVIAGGGSPGHVYPGLSIAEALVESIPGVSVLFAGTGRSSERHLVRAAGYNYVALPARPAPQNPFEAVRFVTDNVIGFCAARWMLGEQETALVVGLGGFASAAVTRAAVGRGIPTVLLEQNAVPSRTTKWLAGMVETVCTGFAETENQLLGAAPIVHTGVPPRPNFLHRYRRSQQSISLTSRSREKRLVILGGAVGAQTLNHVMPEVVGQLGRELAGWRIVHQTGDGQLQLTESRYGAASSGVLTVSHIDELASLLFETDIVVCRSGGTLLAELALAGVPAVLVPFPEASDQHQLANAECYRREGAAVVVDERAAGSRLADHLAAELRLLATDENRRAEMAKSMRRLARPEAAEEIARACGTILGATSSHRAAA